MEQCRLTDPELSQAYREMLEGGLRFPEQRLWYWPWRLACAPQARASGTPVSRGFLPTDGPRSVTGWRGPSGDAASPRKPSGRCAMGAVAAGVQAVEAETEPGNAASQHVLQKNGFLPMGIQGAEALAFV